MEHEWARTAEDVLWRRSKLGLRVSQSEARAPRRVDAEREPPPPLSRRRDGGSGAMTLELRHVTKRVRNETHIDDVSLTFAHGTLNILLGPTLSGKTSLMRLMAGLDAPTEGSVFFDGKDVTGVPVRERSVAMVYQQFINYPNLTVYENIASPLRVAGAKKADLDRRVRETAALMKLTPLLDRKPLELSGGQQQRTALARAIVKQADLVLLDEPLANLDYKLREELREELPRIFSATGAIFVYATTEPLEALLLGGSTATLAQGRVTQFGPTRRCLPAAEQPRDGAHLLRSADQHALRQEERRAASRSAAGHLKLPVSGLVRVAARRRLHDRLPAEPPLPRAARRRTRSRSARPSRSPRSPARKASSTSISPASAGWRWRMASTISRSASRSRSISIRPASSSSTPSARSPPRRSRGRWHRRARWRESFSTTSPTPTQPLRAGRRTTR